MGTFAPRLSIAGWLAAARASGLTRLDALVLAGHALNQPRSWLLAHDDQLIDPNVQQWLTDACQQRLDEVPVAYIVGHKEFGSLMLHVQPGVLVPRPETEGLVDWAVQTMVQVPKDSEPVVADLGTGTGAIALAIKHACPKAQVHAVDSSVEALDLARRNVESLGLPVSVHAGNWWEGTWTQSLRAPIDLVVSNPPYIACGDPHLAALRHEPRMALVSGADGLDALDAIVRGAPRHARRGVWVLLEHGHDQGAAVRDMLLREGYADIQTRRDLAGLERYSGGRVG